MFVKECQRGKKKKKNARKIRKTHSLYPTPGRHYHLVRSSLRKGLACCSNSKESACNAGDQGLIPGLGSSLEKEMAIHSNILAWGMPWTEKLGGL